MLHVTSGRCLGHVESFAHSFILVKWMNVWIDLSVVYFNNPTHTNTPFFFFKLVMVTVILMVNMVSVIVTMVLLLEITKIRKSGMAS